MGLLGGGGTSARRLGMWATEHAINTETGVRDQLLDSREKALSALGGGVDQAVPYYQQASDRLNPWATAGQGALGTYTDSLGQNGQAGYDNAVAQYRETPGYQRRVNEATDKVQRANSSMGMLGSGNTQAAIADRVQGIADEDWTRFQGQLNALSSQGMQAAGAQGQYDKGIGDLYGQQGKDQATVYSGFAPQFSQNAWNQANLSIGSVLGQGKQAADAVASQTNLGLGLAGTALGVLGMPMGGGATLGGGLLNMFKSK